MPIVIKKRVNLDFLGEEYKEAYLIFRSVPLIDYEKIDEQLPKSGPRYIELVQAAQTGELSKEDNLELQKLRIGESENNKKGFRMMLDFLKKYFISGKFPNAETGELEDLKDKSDLDGLDQDAAVRCFNVLTGQDDDPKASAS